MTIRIKITHLCTICLLLLTVTACQELPYYTEHRVIDKNGWYGIDTMVFKVPKSDSDITKDVVIGIRYTNEYKYKNLNVGVKICEGKKVIRTDTLKYSLYSNQDMPEGNGAYYKELRQSIPSVTLIKGHKYKIKVYHIMRLDPIVGFTNLTISM